jgi:hypothetical protein
MIPKSTCTAKRPGSPREIWGPRAKIELWSLLIPFEKILKSQLPEMAKSCILEVCWQLYLYVYFNVILYDFL